VPRKKKKRRIRPPAPPRSNIVYGDLSDAPTNAGPVGGYSEGENIHVLPGVDQYTVAHEMGHLLDNQVLSDGDRNFFARLLQTSPGAWNRGTGAAGGYHSPSEAFADYYAAAATNYDPRPKRKGKAVSGGGVDSYTRIGPKRLRRYKKALERLQARRGLEDYKG
jgi:hypothetical protein